MRLCVKNMQEIKGSAHNTVELEAVKKISQAKSAELDQLKSEYI